MMKLKVFRYDRESGDSRYDTFELDPSPGMTVLSALFKIQEEMDDSLAFRYSCRGAVCGSCGVLINKVPRLACRTRVESLPGGEGQVKLRHFPGMEETVSWDPKEEVLVESLPNLVKIKDLVVDMDKFFEFYRAVEPTFKPASEAPEKERLMDPKAVSELEQYTNCVLCASCVGSCPISGKEEEFLGPAALAKLYRFHIDPREAEDDSRLLLANDKSGWWGCEFNANCKAVCPKGVPPILGIGKARKEIQKLGKEPK
ncbi:succinate dehydrogenase/fumarate reductase iron-sulfur subunit [Methanosarcina sp. KYL-1]|nr:succinate dehydrogenase/fumarate reductase iron-sulfur subunit [Methanosarcina sp. KYL-1]